VKEYGARNGKNLMTPPHIVLYILVILQTFVGTITLTTLSGPKYKDTSARVGAAIGTAVNLLLYWWIALTI
jgi:uncharacterized membrane protein